MTRPVDYSVDSIHTQAWLPEIGKLIVNFGAIEAHTYWWIAALTGDPSESRKILNRKTPFVPRVEQIEKLLKDDRWKNVKPDALDIWGRAKKMAELRNAVAHSPLVFHVAGGEETADWVGIPDFGRLRRVDTEQDSIITLEKLVESVNELCEIGERLSSLLKVIDELADDA